jgi:hypothetical protein
MPGYEPIVVGTIHKTTNDYLDPKATGNSADPIRGMEFDFIDRISPDIQLVNFQDPCRVINPEYQRGGINTVNYVKDVFNDPTFCNTIRVPFSSRDSKPKPVAPEAILKFSLESPFLTFKANCKDI